MDKIGDSLKPEPTQPFTNFFKQVLVKKTLLVYTYIILCSLHALASDSLVFIKSIPLQARLISSDPLGNIYVVKENNSLLRYNSNGDSTGTFNEIQRGKIAQIDATNPLRILLFFSDYSQIVILDNMLSQKNKLKLNTIGLSNINCIANSIDGSIWLYSSSMASLLKVDDQLDLIQTSNLRHLSEHSLEAGFMVEHDRNLYLVDTTEGILKFDQFNLYNTTLHFKTNEVQFFNDYMVYYSMPFLISYNLKSFQEKKIELPNSEDILQVRIERGHVYLLRKNSLDFYSLIEH